MARRPLHDPSGRDTADRAALVVAFALGAGGNVLLKLGGAPVLMTALWPVGVLAGYVVATILSRAIAAEPETVGDNCYYLGFLFTLSSLAVTLYQIRGIDRDGASVIPDVISGFGVALSSTIAGVFLRVALMQMRPDLAQRDREARRDLATGARELRAAMGAASRSLKAVAVEVQQHAAERNRALDEITDAHAERAAAMLERQAELFEATARAFAGRLALDLHEALTEEAARAAATLGEAADRLAAQLHRVADARAEAEAWDGDDGEDDPDEPGDGPLASRPAWGLAEEPAAWEDGAPRPPGARG